LNFITFERDASTHVEPVKIDSGLAQELQNNLMLFFTGSAHHSWTILEEQEKSTRTHKSVAVEALHEVRALADSMRVTLERGDLNGFGSLLDEAWQAKKRISTKISNQRIDRLYDLARQHGAVGGKITGAGGGGFLLLYCESASQMPVRAALAAEGVQEMAFAFEGQGAQVIVNDPFIDGDERAGSRWTFVPA
jgi:D-glycero-alpha-D-manno-heptose-7-phosphate kinase